MCSVEKKLKVAQGFTVDVMFLITSCFLPSNILLFLADECKRKWKNMRDRYLKEVRMEIKSKKQGDFVQSRWKYRQLMNFIAPFTGSRSGVADICNNNNDDDPDNESGCLEGETTLSETVKTPLSITKVPVTQADLKSEAPFVSQLPSQDSQVSQLAAQPKTPPGGQVSSIGKTLRKRRLTQNSNSLPCQNTSTSPMKWLIKDNGSSFPSRHRDEDELFLLSFVPALKRLAPQRRCETKIKIQQMMYEAEFNVAQPEFQEKQTHPESQA